jgi:tetratricopeptide (TPR) repeat protein
VRAAPALFACAALWCSACAGPGRTVAARPRGPVDARAEAAAAELEPDSADEVAEQGAQPRYVSARAYRHYLAALFAREHEDWAGASAELREALIYDARSPHLRTLLAGMLMRQGRVADAEEQLRAALAIDPRHAPALVLAGRIAAARDLPGEARNDFRAAAQAQPRNPEAYRELIHLEVEQNAAAAAAEVALRLEAAARQGLRELSALQRAAAAAPGVVADGDGQLVDDDDGGERAVEVQRLRESSAAAWAEVARAFALRRDDARAADAFAHAEGMDPQEPEVLVSQAQYFESRRRFAEARAAELKLLALRPDAPEVLATLARLSLEEGDLDTATAYARKLLLLAAEQEPGRADAGGGSARARAEEASHEDERRDLAGALLRAGVPMLGAHRSAEALAQFEAALRLFPGHPELVFYRALALQRRGRAREAAQLFEQVAEQPLPRGGAPSFLGAEPAALALDARVQAALSRGREGDGAESRRALRGIFAGHPLDEGAALGLLESYERAGRAGEVLPLFEAALREHPRSETLLYALASAADRSGDKPSALSRMRELLEVAPDHAGALNYVGYSLAEAGGKSELEEAERLLSHAVELRPDDGAIADSYGFCLLRRGQAARALPELVRADKLNPGDPIILSHLGDAQLAMGHREEAALAFRRALQRLSRPVSAPPTRDRKTAARRSAAALAEDDDHRVPDAGDARVRSELEAKLRSLTAR